MNDEMAMLPLLPLRGVNVFPHMVLNFDAGRTRSVAALEEAMLGDQRIFLVMQLDPQMDEPQMGDLHSVGVIARIKQLLKLPGDSVRVLVEGLDRAKMIEIIQDDPFQKVLTQVMPVPESDDVREEAGMRAVSAALQEYVRVSGKLSEEIVQNLEQTEEPGFFADSVAAHVLSKSQDKQLVLDEFAAADRLEVLLRLVRHEIEVAAAERSIQRRVRKQVEKNQREYYLREQMKAIQHELGEESETQQWKERIEEANLPEEVKERALKELERMGRMSSSSPEWNVIHTYLDWILSLPWHETTQDSQDLKNASHVLNEDHYGLEKVKVRVLEYLAVKMLTQSMKGPILCFVGPPGVGKTSIGRSIARALGRTFVRMSLGGVRDEAEIRGHRRTYIGAIPGRIITSMRLAKTNNPLFLLDEVDKMSSDLRGDPASAMLEVLDAEQNYAFRDHYLELPFDLSKVMFVATANSVETIPRPLLDRMELIELSGYTDEEKIEIARRHLLPKQEKEHGLQADSMIISDEAMRFLIRGYTREAGVRQLERVMASLCRKAARRAAEKGKPRMRLTETAIERLLGRPRYKQSAEQREQTRTGVVNGLAWTQVGGEMMTIEVAVMPGKGNVELTGSLGDVMKESARAGISYIRAHAQELGIDPDFHQKFDLHIHVPQGAIPKDGPSAGITMTTALVSALAHVPVRSDIAMTGEITLRGRVLPIGGLKEKSLAAYREGIRTVILPEDNEKDLEDIPQNIRKKLAFVPVEEISTVLRLALAREEE